jgi:hypothetical protein
VRGLRVESREESSGWGAHGMVRLDALYLLWPICEARGMQAGMPAPQSVGQGA